MVTQKTPLRAAFSYFLADRKKQMKESHFAVTVCTVYWSGRLMHPDDQSYSPKGDVEPEWGPSVLP